jgi:alanine-synthesizing transaminase
MSQVVATMGTKEGIAHLLLTVLAPGDTVLVLTPSYPIHASSVALSGAGLVGLPVFASFEEGNAFNWQLDEHSQGFFSRLDESWSRAWPRPRAMLMSFPHNPTGTTVTAGFWKRLVSYALEREILLINDFAYGDICFDSYRAPSLLAVEDASQMAIECYSLSKSFGVAGWRVGFAVGNAEVLAALKKVKSYLDFGIFQAVQLAAADLLQAEACSELSVLEETSSIYEARRDVLVHGLMQAGWQVPNPKAGVFVWSRLPERLLSEGGEGFCRRLLEGYGVAASPGTGFDFSSGDCVRFALVENEARIRRAVKLISTASE